MEQIGQGDSVAVDPNKQAVLLRLTLPEEMRAEAVEKLSPSVQKQFFPVVFEMKLGPIPPPRPTPAALGG